MTGRLTSAVLVSAMIRQLTGEGGNGAVLQKGDTTAGAILLILAVRGITIGVRERGLLPDGTSGWIASGPKDVSDPATLSDYLERRRRSDPDLWVVELDGGSEERVEAILESARA